MALYEYAAEVVRWVDGDTVDLTTDLGFGVSRADRFRLYGVDTPERGQPGHDQATAFCVAAAPEGARVVIRSFKPEAMRQDKYGRWLAEIMVAGQSLNAQLVLAGHAKPYFGGTKA